VDVLAVLLVSVVIPEADNVPVIVVVAALRVPVDTTFDAVSCPAIPAPPETVKAPEEIEVLSVVLVIATSPDALSAVTLVFPDVREVTVVAPEESDPVTRFPAVICPATPRPPEMIRAPVLDVVLAVVLVKKLFPDTVSDEAVALPVTMALLVSCPTIPTPPETTRAPVAVVVLPVVLLRVVIPEAVKFVTDVFPDKSVPVVTCPDTPTPPVMTTDPVVVLVLAVPLVKLEIPEKVGLFIVEIVPPVMLMLVPAVYMVVPTSIPFE